MPAGNETPCNCLPYNTFPATAQIFKQTLSDGSDSQVVGGGASVVIDYTAGTIVYDNAGLSDLPNSQMIIDRTGLWDLYASLQIPPPGAPSPTTPSVISGVLVLEVDLGGGFTTAERGYNKFDWTTSPIIGGLFLTLVSTRIGIPLTIGDKVRMSVIFDNFATVGVANPSLTARFSTSCTNPATAPLPPI